MCWLTSVSKKVMLEEGAGGQGPCFSPVNHDDAQVTRNEAENCKELGTQSREEAK